MCVFFIFIFLVGIMLDNCHLVDMGKQSWSGLLNWDCLHPMFLRVNHTFMCIHIS